MAINASDISFSIIPEDTLGVTPATGKRYALPAKSGQALPTYSANEIKSDTMRPNRASNGSRRGNGSGDGTFDFRFQNTDAIDYLIASAVSGVWEEDGNGVKTTIKAAKTDSSFTSVCELKSDWFQMSTGCICTGFTFDSKAAAEVSASFPFSFIGRSDSATDSAIVTTAANEGMEFVGSEVSNIKLNGSALTYTELQLEVKQDRSPRNVLGSTVPTGMSTTGNREVTVTLKFYKESIEKEAAYTGERQSLTFEVGVAGDGYRFTIPAGQASYPTDDSSDDIITSVVFTAAYDNASGTDLIIEKL